MTALEEKPGKIKAFLRLVMIEHSIFALPFAYLSALVAVSSLNEGVGEHWLDLVLVTIAQRQPHQHPPECARRMAPAEMFC